MKFIKRKENQSEDPKGSGLTINWNRLLLGLPLALVMLAIIVYGFAQCKSFLTITYQNWNEIKFAYEKPALVKKVRVDYQSKQSKFEQSFLNSTTDKKVLK